jgi:hypothetical protein
MASNSSAAGRARNSASEGAPSEATKSAPSRSPVASGFGPKAVIGVSAPPLSPMARANRPFASGEVISALTSSEPADSPNTVTRLGSPPKAEMLACTHFSAAI